IAVAAGFEGRRYDFRGLRLIGLSRQGRIEPALFGCETPPVRVRQRLELFTQHACTGGADVVDRAATEGCEAGAEDHPGIQQFGIRDHVIVQASHGFVEHRQDQAFFKIGGLAVAGIDLRLLGLAVLPHIETLAIFLATLAALHLVGDAGGKFQVEEWTEFLAHGQCDVESYRIDQFNRSHRHAEAFARPIDRGIRNALGVAAHGLQEVRHRMRLTRNPGVPLTGNGSLPMAFTQAQARFSSVGSRLSWRTTSTSGICATGLKKCKPRNRRGSMKATRNSSSAIDDVLVAISASGAIFGSSIRYTASLASGFS